MSKFKLFRRRLVELDCLAKRRGRITFQFPRVHCSCDCLPDGSELLPSGFSSPSAAGPAIEFSLSVYTRLGCRLALSLRPPRPSALKPASSTFGSARKPRGCSKRGSQLRGWRRGKRQPNNCEQIECSSDDY